jgi:hypothetical protein
MDIVWLSVITVIGIVIGNFMLLTLGMWTPDKKKVFSK